MKQIVLTGSLSVDRIMQFPGSFKDHLHPDKLDKVSLSVLLSGFTDSRGGIAGNIAYSLALLSEKPLLLASVGEDQRKYMNDLARMGVDITSVHFSPLPTASFSVITDSHHCQIGGFYPGAMGDAENLSFAPFANKKALMVLSAHDPSQMERQIDEVAQYGLELCFDVGQQVIALSKETLLKGLKSCRLLIVNEYEMDLMAEIVQVTREEIIQMVPVCVVTKGVDGSAYEDDTIKAVSGIEVKDPTGAGDAFRAGFFYGYVRDWPHRVSIQLGSVIASFAIEHMGTQNHTFTRADVEQRFFETYQEKIIWERAV